MTNEVAEVTQIVLQPGQSATVSYTFGAVIQITCVEGAIALTAIRRTNGTFHLDIGQPDCRQLPEQLQ